MAEMQVAGMPRAEPELRIGRTLRRSLAILGRNFVAFIVLSAITTSPSLVAALLENAGKMTPGRGVALAVSGLLSLILMPLVQAILLHGAFQDMRGRPVRLGESAKHGLARFFPVIGVAFSVAVACALGFLLLIVPGVILYLMFSVAQPVCVVERLGPFQSLERSKQLTKGYRGSIFGVSILVVIVSAILTTIASFVFAHLFGLLVASIANFIVSAIVTAFNAVLFVVIYHDLRVLKEGIDIEKIAAVFD